MGVVPPSIAMPRLPTPRTVVPPGSVGIAESQTGIYPTATPGGWRIIGRTPVSLYRPQSSSPFLFSPGDRVQFYPIDADEFTGFPMLRRLDEQRHGRARHRRRDGARRGIDATHYVGQHIACGGHAGSRDLMRRTASVAQQHGVAMRAHPGLPDRETFGRTERPVTANEIRALVSEQVMVCGRVLKRKASRCGM